MVEAYLSIVGVSADAPSQYASGFAHAFMNVDIYDEMNDCFPKDIHLANVIQSWMDEIQNKDFKSSEQTEKVVTSLFEVDIFACNKNEFVMNTWYDTRMKLNTFKQ